MFINIRRKRNILIAKYYEVKFNDGKKQHNLMLVGFDHAEALEKLDNEYIGKSDQILEVKMDILNEDRSTTPVGTYMVKYTAPIKGSSRLLDDSEINLNPA